MESGRKSFRIVILVGLKEIASMSPEARIIDSRWTIIVILLHRSQISHFPISFDHD